MADLRCCHAATEWVLCHHLLPRRQVLVVISPNRSTRVAFGLASQQAYNLAQDHPQKTMPLLVVMVCHESWLLSFLLREHVDAP